MTMSLGPLRPWRGYGMISLIAILTGCRAAPPAQRAPAGMLTLQAEPVTQPAMAPNPSSDLQIVAENGSPAGTAGQTGGAAPRFTVYRSAAEPPTGRACRVHLRRDAVGLAAPAPLGVGYDSLANKASQIGGTIDQVTDDWLVLRAQGKRYWIPRGVILAVEIEDEPK